LHRWIAGRYPKAEGGSDQAAAREAGKAARLHTQSIIDSSSLRASPFVDGVPAFGVVQRQAQEDGGAPRHLQAGRQQRDLTSFVPSRMVIVDREKGKNEENPWLK
jgi:hypothetical protein